MNVKATFNPDDVTRLSRGFALAVQASAMRTATHLAEQAKGQLREFDERLGHHQLATLWTYDVEPTPDGAKALVYSAAEEMTFFNENVSGAQGRARSSLYPIEGDRLLAILEGGASRHFIFPTGGRQALALPGTEANARKFAAYVYTPTPKGDQAELRSEVVHPGVKPNHNIATTREMLIQGLAQTAKEALQYIAIELK